MYRYIIASSYNNIYGCEKWYKEVFENYIDKDNKSLLLLDR